MDLFHSLIQHMESEVVEFKKAERSFDYDDMRVFNYTISIGVAKASKQLPGYTRVRGLERDKIKQMILQYIQNAGTGQYWYYSVMASRWDVGWGVPVMASHDPTGGWGVQIWCGLVGCGNLLVKFIGGEMVVGKKMVNLHTYVEIQREYTGLRVGGAHIHAPPVVSGGGFS